MNKCKAINETTHKKIRKKPLKKDINGFFYLKQSKQMK